MYPTPEFLRTWKTLVDRAPNAAWLMAHEDVLVPLAWQVWKAGREKMYETVMAPRLQRA